ncbi:MAG: DUF1566 domain-containing protein [Burkholderiales bacterium]|nr:DUF1566 domain-containing protein [Burkholderiales bacterium]
MNKVENKMKMNFTNYRLISSFLIAGLIAGCGSSSSNVADNNNNLNNAISVEKSATIPVLNGQATNAGVYIRNTTAQTISGISYALVASTNTTTAALTLSKTACTSIAANSSCLLPLTTPALSAGNNGSNLLVATFKDGQQSKQLINYRYLNTSDYSGVNFSDKSQSLFGTNDYATVYVFVGNNQSQSNVSFNASNNSLAVSRGLINGKVDIPANTLIPLEIQSNQNVTANLVTLTPYTATSSRQLSAALNLAEQNNSQLQVSITPTQQANLLMSNVSTLTQSESVQTLTVVNNGNQTATSIGLTSASADVVVGTADINPCTPSATLSAGSSCNYKISLNNNYNNGSALLTLAYNNSVTTVNATQTAYYSNNNSEPMVAAVATQTSFTEQVNSNQNITFNVTNSGGAPLNSFLASIKTTLAHTTLTIQNNDCGNSLAANGSCTIQVNVAASGLIDSGIIYLNISGRYTGAATKNYSFMSKPVRTSITDSTLPTVTSTTPQNTDTGVSTATAITVNFSESMTAITLNTTNITLQKVSDGSAIPLSLQAVAEGNQSVTFTQSSGPLASSTEYQIVIDPSQIKDMNGNAMNPASSSQIVASFTTGDTLPPTISSFAPANGATNQSQTPTISISFSKAMDQSTLTTSNVILQTQAGTAVAGYTISYASGSNLATINLNGTLLTSQTTYQLRINQTAVKSSNGVAVGSDSNYLISSFTVGDFTAPTLSSTVPVNGSTTVAKESAVSLTFSEAMNTATLVSPNIQLQKVSDSSTVVLNSPPSYSNGNKTVTFQPSADLAVGESYNLVINPSAIKDVAGNAISGSSSQTVSNFTIATIPAVTRIYLPQTGQMNQVPSMCSPLSATCINSPAGSDGYGYASGPYHIPYGVAWAYNGYDDLVPPVRFTSGSDAEAGCITDNLTGLMWVKNLNTVAINDSTAGSKTSWQNALDSIATANSGSGYCGHTDWWLPNVNEMASLINQGAANSATWLNSKGFSNVQVNIYWSSTSYAVYPTFVWNVDMGSGTVNNVSNVSSGYVWPVRRNSVITTPPAQIPQTGQTTTYSTGDDGSLQKGTVGTNSTGRFVVATDPSGNVCTSGEEVESDLQTGLMWVKAPSSTKYTWANAILSDSSGGAIPSAYCGYSDWRLPNSNELRSLANYGQSNVTTWLNAQGFSNVQEGNYWSSSTYASDTSYAWNVTMKAGIVIRGVKTGTNYVWPVRGGQ